MPNNPLTEQELYEISILRSLTPPLEVTGATAPYMPKGYFSIPPHDQDGPVQWRRLNAGHITEGIMDPSILGTGYTGAGNLYLADDGTWKAITVGGTTTNSNVLIDGGTFTSPNNALIDAGTFT